MNIQITFPRLDSIQDPEVRRVLQELAEQLRVAFTEIKSPATIATTTLQLSAAKTPTQANLPDLRPGTVYRDSADGNRLKMKV